MRIFEEIVNVEKIRIVIVIVSMLPIVFATTQKKSANERTRTATLPLCENVCTIAADIIFGHFMRKNKNSYFIIRRFLISAFNIENDFSLFPSHCLCLTHAAFLSHTLPISFTLFPSL